jgi:phospholipid/cholesterol/gamma-HCH transport system substrate-binding protein
MKPSGKKHKARMPPYFTAGLAGLVILAAVLAAVWLQFRGQLLPRTQLTMLAARSGLSMDPGAKVTYNGVSIGRVAKVEEITQGGQPRAKFTLEVDPKYVNVIPANVHAEVEASTAFGNKYVAFSSPETSVAQHVSSAQVIDATHVTTEFNTLFETVVSIAEKVDPVKLNATLAAASEALDGLGDKFGTSISNANDILGDLNARMPQIRHDVQRVADLADVYVDASPDLWSFLRNAATVARTFNENQANLDAALLASIGLGNTTSDIFERGGPSLRRALQDLVSTSELLDYYSPELFCTVHNLAELVPVLHAEVSGNGYALKTHTQVIGAANPWVYPDNLPRVNAHGGPEGRPGCWQRVSRDLWPAPFLVLDTGAARHRTTILESAPRTQWNTCGVVKWGRTRSTHEDYRYRDQARRLLAGGTAVHRAHHRGVRSIAV